MEENIEVIRDDSVFFSAVVFLDKDGKQHIYSPAISLEEFNEKMKEK